MFYSFTSVRIKFLPSELETGTNFFSCLTCIFNFKTRSIESKIISKAEMLFENIWVNRPSKNLKPLSQWCKEVTLFVMTYWFLKSIAVLVHFFLRIDVLKWFSSTPPLIVRLNNNSIGLKLFDQFPRSVGQHCALIACSYEIDFFSLKSFCQVEQSGFKTWLSKSKTI